jgi:hypothetical protein
MRGEMAYAISLMHCQVKSSAATSRARIDRRDKPRLLLAELLTMTLLFPSNDEQRFMCSSLPGESWEVGFITHMLGVSHVQS